MNHNLLNVEMLQSSASNNDENILNPLKRIKKKEAHSSVVRLDGIESWPEVQRDVRL